MKNKHKQQLVKISRLLGHVAAEKIEPLVGKHKADFSANKLHTAIFLKLFLYAWSFDRSELSLRTIAEYSRSETFKELAELDETKKTFDTMKMHSPMALEITTGKVKDFLKKFGLERYIVLHESMLADDIKRAIELGYEARMWELTNDLED